MEIRSVYTMPRMRETHRRNVRIRDALVIHWMAVLLLVIGQFTVIPMLAMIAADTHRPVSYSVRSDDGYAGWNTTTVFKEAPTLLSQ